MLISIISSASWTSHLIMHVALYLLTLARIHTQAHINTLPHTYIHRRLLLLPISFHGLTTATVSLWVHLILSSNLSRKFRTLLQDLFSWHPVNNLSWKKLHWHPTSERIKYKVHNVLSIKSLECVSVLQMVLVLLTSLNCCMSTLHLVHYALLLTPACWKSNNTNARLMASAPSLALDPTFGIHSHKTLDTAQPCHLLKPN